MKILHIIEQSAPRRRVIDKSEEKKYSEYFWDVVNSVRNGRYKSEPGDVNAVANQIEEERRINNR